MAQPCKRCHSCDRRGAGVRETEVRQSLGEAASREAAEWAAAVKAFAWEDHVEHPVTDVPVQRAANVERRRHASPHAARVVRRRELWREVLTAKGGAALSSGERFECRTEEDAAFDRGEASSSRWANRVFWLASLSLLLRLVVDVCKHIRWAEEEPTEVAGAVAR